MSYLVTARYETDLREYECDGINIYDFHAILYEDGEAVHVISFRNKNFLGLDIEQEGLL